MRNNIRNIIIGIFKRSFSTTCVRKEPLTTTSLAFSTPYSSSLLANPYGAAFILLMGMSVSLFFLTTGLTGFFEHGPELELVLERLESLFLLYEKFIAYERSGTDMFLVNINSFTPENLQAFYSLFQELVTTRESLFTQISKISTLPEITYLPDPIKDRIDDIYEDFRGSGNDLVALIRTIEDKLNIPVEQRLPSFWFED